MVMFFSIQGKPTKGQTMAQSQTSTFNPYVPSTDLVDSRPPTDTELAGRTGDWTASQA